MTISSGIIFIFTSLLFLSGYVLQQQTVHSIQAALHPPPPSVPTASPSITALARPFGHPPGSKGYASYQKLLGGLAPDVDWKKVAYVQLVTGHMTVCNAVMIFAELAAQKSRARRVLLYPKSWDRGIEQDGARALELERSMRLIGVAAVRYGVVLAPIEAMLDVGEGELSPDMSDNMDATFPLSGLLSLTRFDHILYLRPSGLIVDSSILDTLFSIPTNATFTSFLDPSNDQSPLTLITPSKSAFQTALTSLRSDPLSEASYLHNNTHFLTPPSTLAPVVSRTTSLHNVSEDFESGDFLSQAGYVQLHDEGIKGPEYNIPRDVFLQSRPEPGEARTAWEELYEMYRMRRMDVCGLDLEPMPVIYELDIETENGSEVQ
ncbi:hypothetical protein MMC11_007095 [Xylographa trunciseda]|nr:hypothetical protein [Xylographa trunciseda]